MRLPPFRLHQPPDLREALDLLSSLGDEARPVAGGTMLLPVLRMGLMLPSHLVSLQGVEALHGLRAGASGLLVGALTTYDQLARSPQVQQGWPLLARAAASVATPAIRTMGTLGGNLAYATANSDVSPALLALEATVRLAGPDGEREVPITSFFTGLFESDIRPGELVTGVFLPNLPPGSHHSYLRFPARSREDWPLVNVAVLAVREEVRIALGGVAPTPIRARRAEERLRGQPLTPEAIAEAADLASQECDPPSDLKGSADYRWEMVRVWVRRALNALFQ